MLNVKINSNVTKSNDINKIYDFISQNENFKFKILVIEPIFKDYLKLTNNKKILSIIKNLNKTIDFISKGTSYDENDPTTLIDDFSADLIDELFTYKSDFIDNFIKNDKNACEYVLKMVANNNRNNVSIVETDKF